MNLASGSVRITSSTSRRQRIFAVTQIAASFVLLAGAGMLITTLIALQAPRPVSIRATFSLVDVPALSYGKTRSASRRFLQGIDTSHQCAARRHRDGFRCRSLPGAMPTPSASVCNSPVMVTSMAKTILARSGAPSLPAFSARFAFPFLPGAISTSWMMQESRAGRDRQPDSRTAHVSWPGSDQSARLLDRSRARVFWRHRQRKGAIQVAAPHYWRRRRCGRRTYRSRRPPQPFTACLRTVPCSAATSSSIPPEILMRW